MARLIDADNLYLGIVEKGQASKRYKIGERWELNCEEIREVIDAQPTVEPKTGGWEMKPDHYGFFDEIPVCSECGCTTKWREKYLYCPNCGASMARGEEDE